MTGVAAERELIKHAAAIRVANRMSLIERRIWNACLYRAYHDMMTREVHSTTVASLQSDLDYHGRNIDWIKNAFRALNSLQLEWDILSEQAPRWGVTTALAHAEVIGGQYCEWSYAQPMRKELYRPEIYARLNLQLQNRFGSTHSLALWEFFSLNLRDCVGAEVKLELQEFRSLLGLEEGSYRSFPLLQRRIIKHAVAEINAKSDVQVTVARLHTGRRTTGLEFHIRRQLPPSTASSPAPEPLYVRMLNDFGLSDRSAREFLEKFAERHYLARLLDGCEEKYKSGGVRQGKLTAYTMAALKGATARQPTIEARHEKAQALRGLRLTPDEYRDRGEALFLEFTDEQKNMAQRRWMKLQRLSVLTIEWQKTGLGSTWVRDEFYVWLGKIMSQGADGTRFAGGAHTVERSH